AQVCATGAAIQLHMALGQSLIEGCRAQFVGKKYERPQQSDTDYQLQINPIQNRSFHCVLTLQMLDYAHRQERAQDVDEEKEDTECRNSTIHRARQGMLASGSNTSRLKDVPRNYQFEGKLINVKVTFNQEKNHKAR